MAGSRARDRELRRQADEALRVSAIDDGRPLPSRDDLSPDELERLGELSGRMEASLAALLRAATPFLRAATESEWNVLNFLDDHDDRDCTPAHIAQEIMVTKARVTQICNGLETKGLIQRHPDKHDRRKVCFTLTEAGQAQCAQRSEKFRLLLQNYLLHLGPEDAAEVIHLLSRTADIVSRYDMTNANAFINGR